MNKRKQRLFALLAVLFFFVGVYAVVRITFAKGDPQEKPDPSLLLLSVDEGDITEISYAFGETRITLCNNDGKWVLAGDGDFPASQKLAADMAKVFSRLTANSEVKDTSGRFPLFGLDHPQRSISVRYRGGQQQYHFGIQNTVTGEYYLNPEGTSLVYMVNRSIPEKFFFNLPDLVEMDFLPLLRYENIVRFSVANEGKQTSVSFHPGGLPGFYSSRLEWFMTGENPESLTPAGTRRVRDFFVPFSRTEFRFTRCVAYQPTTEQLDAFGLLEPRAVLTVAYRDGFTREDKGEDTEKSLVLLVGAPAEAGFHYARREGSALVYTLADSRANVIAGFAPSRLRSLDVCLIEPGTIESMGITLDDKEYEVLVTRGGGETSDAVQTGADQADAVQTDADQADIDDLLFTINGHPVQPSSFLSFYTRLTDLQAESFIDETALGEAPPKEAPPYLTIVFRRNTDSFSSMELQFIPYDEHFFLAGFPGDRNLLVNRMDVLDLATRFQSINP